MILCHQTPFLRALYFRSIIIHKVMQMLLECTRAMSECVLVYIIRKKMGNKNFCYPFILFIFRSFTSFFMLTTSVLMLSTSLSILKILSFISVRFFVISLLAAIDSFITGIIYLYKKNPINKHIVVGKPTLFISPTISLISNYLIPNNLFIIFNDKIILPYKYCT